MISNDTLAWCVSIKLCGIYGTPALLRDWKGVRLDFLNEMIFVYIGLNVSVNGFMT
ncbi:uncharacterized protein METZ01_LOCUS70842 [marine metagenome]|uniref:Uncharacterized protein n=1 Tax=marine metagenome TaxID=408172 RepID=A0A381TR55_9ZZZZ